MIGYIDCSSEMLRIYAALRPRSHLCMLVREFAAAATYGATTGHTARVSPCFMTKVQGGT